MYILRSASTSRFYVGTRMDIAVVDTGASLKAFVRMAGAWLESIDISMCKARTTRWFHMNTGEIGKLSQPGGLYLGSSTVTAG
jgi:uncharacterized protein GlcG (DUF336 family)